MGLNAQLQQHHSVCGEGRGVSASTFSNMLHTIKKKSQNITGNIKTDWQKHMTEGV
jgi:hypothetical protein